MLPPSVTLAALAQAFDEGNLSITYADVADDMGDDVVWSGASYVFPSSDSSDPTHTCIEKMTVACPNARVTAAQRALAHNLLAATGAVEPFVAHFGSARVAAVDLVGDDDAIVDGAKPARHDDADRAGMECAADFFRQFHADFKTFKLGAE